ncbi:MAG TPA: choice-of-anchor V domain-containing protein [Pyrinomonadaceae bacterium]|jgi:hypothetical protein
MKKIKILCLLFFIGLAFVGFTKNNYFVYTTSAFSTGPPAAVSGAPGETTCAACHFTQEPTTGQFTITAPANYNPGQTYQIVVRHITSDTTRRRWGFELTPLAGTTAAGTLASTSGNTQITSGNGRSYMEHTLTGSFGGQTGGAVWTFNWTAPATNVGPVTFYAAGNQANNDGTSDGDLIFTTTATSQPPAVILPDPTVFDFDGDGKTDISIFRPGPGEWWYLKSSNGGNAAFQFGSGSDTLTPGDYTGDGKTDIAFWRPSTGEWFVLRSENFSFFSFPFGTTGDVPAPGDYDGDGKTDAAVFRPSTTTWFIPLSSGGTTIQQFGVSGDVPAVADYDNDGKSDIAIFRPSLGEWWLQRSTAGLIAFQFGTGTDKTVQGDYTGDGKADVAFFRPSTGEWFVLRSEDFSFFSFPFGTTGDVPAPGDYDGDGKIDAAVFRPSNTTWFVQRSTAGTLIQGFGIAGDVPVPSAFVR